MRRKLLAVAVLGLLAAGACTDSSTPSGPSAALTVNGNWQTDVSVAGQSARMTWVLTQSGTAVSGPVTVALQNGIVLMNGTLAGTVSGATATSASLTYTLSVVAGGIPTQPACSGQFGGSMTATAGTPATMTGDFSLKSATCTPPSFTSGSLTLTKQ